jgi:hypothetical protein
MIANAEPTMPPPGRDQLADPARPGVVDELRRQRDQADNADQHGHPPPGAHRLAEERDDHDKKPAQGPQERGDHRDLLAADTPFDDIRGQELADHEDLRNAGHHAEQDIARPKLHREPDQEHPARARREYGEQHHLRVGQPDGPAHLRGIGHGDLFAGFDPFGHVTASSRSVSPRTEGENPRKPCGFGPPHPRQGQMIPNSRLNRNARPPLPYRMPTARRTSSIVAAARALHLSAPPRMTSST